MVATPWLAVTPGEPAGIGPECLVRLVLEVPDDAAPLLAVCDPGLLRDAASSLGADLDIVDWSPSLKPVAGQLACQPVPLIRRAASGILNTRNAAYVLDTLREAVRLVRGGEAGALVTGPVHKGVINDAGIHFTGHTEFLAELAGVPRVVMMLAADELRVALVTTHLSLRAVPDAITGEAVESAIRVTGAALRGPFGIDAPRIQVLGLNPHAGEDGHLGREDNDVIAPAIEHCRGDGLDLTGPVPADTAFTPAALARCDAVLAMYHDQGLPVLKHAGFGRAVNITLGLPFVRTSVDHGTALDIAGRGQADASSLLHAVRAARTLCRT